MFPTSSYEINHISGQKESFFRQQISPHPHIGYHWPHFFLKKKHNLAHLLDLFLTHGKVLGELTHSKALGDLKIGNPNMGNGAVLVLPDSNQ
jgi:hypothetical protein